MHRKGWVVTHSRDRCQSKYLMNVWRTWIKIEIVKGGVSNLQFKGRKDYSVFQGVTGESMKTQRTEWKKLIRPSVQTHSTFLSLRKRRTVWGLTRVVITRLKPGSDSNMTRMNGPSNYPNQDTCSWKLYIYLPLHFFFSQGLIFTTLLSINPPVQSCV